MNRTGLIVLAAAVVALSAGAYWFMTPQSERMKFNSPKSEMVATTDTSAAPPSADEQTAAAPPVEPASPVAPEQPAPAEALLPDATTAPADQLGGLQANEERQTRGRKAEEVKDSEADDAKLRIEGYSQAVPPPPPPPPPPVSSAPPMMAPTPAPAPAPLPPPTRTAARPAIPAREEIPVFPWPVPQATATLDVPRQLIIGNTNTPTFGSVAERIASALDHAGYGERSFYALADGRGIAIATQLEQINDDGTPVVGVARFELTSATPSTKQFSLTSYVKALFSARGTRYRIIVFTLSGGVAQDGKPPSEDKATGWVMNGGARLPQRYALIPFTDQVTCTALVYEFEKKTFADAAAFVPAGKLNAKSHLTNAGIWTPLGRP